MIGTSPVTLDAVLGRLRGWIAASGLTQKDIAAAAGVSGASVLAVVWGRSVSQETIERIEMVVPVDYVGFGPIRDKKKYKSKKRA